VLLFKLSLSPPSLAARKYQCEERSDEYDE